MNGTVLFFSLCSVAQALCAAGMMANSGMFAGSAFMVGSGFFAFLADCYWTKTTVHTNLQITQPGPWPPLSRPEFEGRVIEAVNAACRDGRLKL